jgi:hypothetical protein
MKDTNMKEKNDVAGPTEHTVETAELLSFNMTLSRDRLVDGHTHQAFRM